MTLKYPHAGPAELSQIFVNPAVPFFAFRLGGGRRRCSASFTKRCPFSTSPQQRRSRFSSEELRAEVRKGCRRSDSCKAGRRPLAAFRQQRGQGQGWRRSGGSRGFWEGFLWRAVGSDVVRLLLRSRARFQFQGQLGAFRCAGPWIAQLGSSGPGLGKNFSHGGRDRLRRRRSARAEASSEGPRSSEPGWLLS